MTKTNTLLKRYTFCFLFFDHIIYIWTLDYTSIIIYVNDWFRQTFSAILIIYNACLKIKLYKNTRKDHSVNPTFLVINHIIWTYIYV